MFRPVRRPSPGEPLPPIIVKLYAMKGLCVLIVGLMVSGSTLGQTSLQKAKSDSLKSRNFIVKWTYSSMIANVAPHYGFLTLGVEKNISKRISVSADYGYGLDYGPTRGSLVGSNAEEVTGYLIQVESKYYLHRYKFPSAMALIFWPLVFQAKGTVERINSGYYLSVHGIYKHTDAKKEETIPGGTNNYNVSRNLAGFHVRLGYQTVKMGGLTFDQAIGFGLRHIASESSNKMGTNNFGTEYLYDKKYDEGSGIYPSVYLNFKIGWSF